MLSPSQVGTFLDCQARWGFKYGLQLPESKNSSLALGLAVHRALELNFREKLETHEDLDTAGVVTLFRDAWMEQVGQTQFMPDESQHEFRRLGERLVAKYMDEVAPKIEPAAVEMGRPGRNLRGSSTRANRPARLGWPPDRHQNRLAPAVLGLTRLRLSTGNLPADHTRSQRRGSN